MPTPHYGQPRYRAIAGELRRRIESGIIPPGSLLPAESALTAEFAASRGTIRQAIAVLRDDGLATTEHGRGTYAIARPYASALIENSNLNARRREVAADADLAKLFDIAPGSILVMRETVTCAQDKVESVVRVYQLLNGDR
ncbi:GntR family transcriptional regulator [Micromonospora sp. NBC_01655]|uniref:GntR family transcriptional regulator n=1 Tax=Micromonospora sp. NBC_01655 TaxID=2975983 RepID=UPI002253C56E|nr:GntR family transcriptional regulator [Micromonospora sp. NBC_01655]MCX4469102.1 GntR family transcriptional regulator [Micromonospora sp. NBC_01655]